MPVEHIEEAPAREWGGREPGWWYTATRAARFNPPRRADLSFAHARAVDIEAFSYTITTGRWKILDNLSPRAKRVLRFFCALNRSGEAGFRGTRCTLGALAAAIQRCTEEAASKRTIQRALKELVVKGYLLRSNAWGKSRLIGGLWRREQICTYTLTDKAIAVWSKPKKSDVCLPMTKCPTDDRRNPEFFAVGACGAKRRRSPLF